MAERFGSRRNWPELLTFGKLYLVESTDLPLPADLQAELHRIIHEQDEDLLSIRFDNFKLLPTVQAYELPHWQRNDLGERERRLYAIEEEISAAIAEQPSQRERDALNALFLFEEEAAKTPIGERHLVAGEALGVSDEAFRKTHEERLLRKLALSIYRRQLGWCIRQLQARRRFGGWFEMTSQEWSADMTGATPVWTTRMGLRCVAPVAQPVYVIRANWEDGPRSVDEVRIISAPPDEEVERGFPYRLIHLRPADESILAGTAYFFDLGVPKQVGDVVDLAFVHDLGERGAAERPFLGVTTKAKPNLRTIRLRVKLPGDAPAPTFYERTESPEGSNYSAPTLHTVNSGRVEEQDEDGYYIYEPQAVVFPYTYELWWGKRTGKVVYPTPV